MRRWSDLAERVAATTRTSEKTALLADYLRSLTADELPIARAGTPRKLTAAAIAALAAPRNLIVNGFPDVWQRGTSFTNQTVSGAVTYAADRWLGNRTAAGDM